MRADLVMVATDPLKSIAALQQPLGVMTAGRWRTRQQLEHLLTAQKAKYDAVLH
jgi:hypothetical protein